MKGVDPITQAREHWERHCGPALAPEMTAVTSLMRVQQLLLAELNRILRPFELTFARYEALMLLRFSRHGRLPLGKMGERLQVHPASVTNIVDRLESSGLMRRVPHSTDRRATVAEITVVGKRVAELATHQLQQQLHVGLSERELDCITAILRRVRRAYGDDVGLNGAEKGVEPPP